MEKGLSALEAQQKLKIFGKNEIKTKKPISPLSLFLSQFPSVINAVLFVAALFSFLMRDLIDGFFIIAILILNALFGFIQEYRAEKSLEKLKTFITPISRVLRDGKEIQVPTSELVPQDIIILSEGDRIPADGRLLLTHNIEIDESILTGESLSVIKKQGDFAFGGTLVIKGRARLVIEKTGIDTRFGQIAKTLSILETDKSPLQIKLNSLGKALSLIAVIVAVSLVPIGTFQGKELFPLMLIAVSIGIAAIPEGLPAVITIALAIGTNRMARKNAIVRKMQSVETLGAIQVILIDKTGTLTQNIMRVKKFWTKDKKDLENFFMACVLGNTASLAQKANNKFDAIGDRTDGALLLFAKDNLRDINEIKQKVKIINEYEFDPETRTATTIVEKGNKKYVFVRGAPEEIILKSKLSLSDKEKIQSLFEQYAKEGLRVIGLGSKQETKDGTLKREDYEKDLNFLGFVGIYDPARPEAKQAVKNAKNAGIKTIMVTGDNELTALSIAKDVGLIEEDEEVITGPSLEKITDEELEKIILKTRIYARTKPEDKLRLVTIFKKLGFIVGVTGDGVNDALALKRADVGIAMGESGTDVAKEASDIILTDDNFSTIVNAIEEGRTIYKNILKSITYLLSGNIAEISTVFFALVLGMPTPFFPTQILWINLVTDGLPALALASDIKTHNVLNHSPRNSKTSILTKKRLFFIAVVGLSLSFVLLFIFRSFLLSHGEIFARTVIFNLIVFFHLIIIFIVRGGSFFRMNRFLALTILITVIMQICITTIPFFRDIFHLST